MSSTRLQRQLVSSQYIESDGKLWGGRKLWGRGEERRGEERRERIH
jgi:hypothetical protein